LMLARKVKEQVLGEGEVAQWGPVVRRREDRRRRILWKVVWESAEILENE